MLHDYLPLIMGIGGFVLCWIIMQFKQDEEVPASSEYISSTALAEVHRREARKGCGQ